MWWCYFLYCFVAISIPDFSQPYNFSHIFLLLSSPYKVLPSSKRRWRSVSSSSVKAASFSSSSPIFPIRSIYSCKCYSSFLRYS